ncbi:MAG TPA: A24 family peptidase [Candidatus Aquilonibacter sp.]
MTVALLIFLAACAIACVTDSRSRRIPNVLTYAAIGIALALAGSRGALPFAEAFGAALLMLLVGSALLALGWLGGGDVKLLAAGAATVGFPSFLIVIAYIAVAGGLFAAITAWRDGRLQAVLSHITYSIAGKTAIVADPRARRVPYALAICAGTCYYAASESIAPWLQLVR